MKRSLSIAFLCMTFMFMYSRINAQVSAGFTSGIPTGCSPLIVSFTDASTGNPASWRWDLGNGTISTLRNPTATYFNPGSYTVKLVVRGSSGTDSLIRQQFVTVYRKPVVSFSAADSSGCFPLMVNFTDQSSAGSGSIGAYAWDFGDGSTSTEVNPSHLYTLAGNFTVSLRVTNSNGCSNSYANTAYIHVTAGVHAAFSNNSASTCEASPVIRFVNSSTGPGNLSYEWHFGDGQVSALANPIHTYTMPGSYAVTLITMSPQGCRDTMVKQNLISFGLVHSVFTAPDNICARALFSPVNNSVPAPGSVLWTFGDGTSSTQLTPLKAYATPGSYRIRLINDFGGCHDTAWHNIVVRVSPVASFAANTVNGCKVPFTANFTPSATGNNTYAWSFGDGGTSVVRNAAHTYTTAGQYTVRLVVTNSAGCSDTLTRTNYINIQRPTIVIDGFPRTGCFPLTVRPTAVVTANQPITTWLWNFGDGTTSSQQNPAHSYTRAGTFTVTLTITTLGGCTQTLSIPAAVRTGGKPDAGFLVQPRDVCASQAVIFTDTTRGNVDQWLWSFGDGDTSTVQNPRYNYVDTGFFSVTLVVWSNTCADTVTLNHIVHIKPPIAIFDVVHDCRRPMVKQFYEQSIGATTWSWNFGDGQVSTQRQPVHTYASLGSYSVTLTVTNGTCSYTARKTVRVLDENPVIIADRNAVCKDNGVNFRATGVNVANISAWNWDFADGSLNDTTPSIASHIYHERGTFTVRLNTRDALGCNDTASVVINIYGPRADFIATVPSACLGSGPTIFTDRSITDGTNAINRYSWNYGDGVMDSSPAGPFTHNYTAAANYTVQLAIRDAFGCSDTISKDAAILISRPSVNFYSPDTSSCKNIPVSFINASSGNGLRFNWTLGDGATSTDINPVHSYVSTGTYGVKLIAVDEYGCRDSLARPSYIRISMPTAAFTVSDSLGSCPPLAVIFTNHSINQSAVSWDFGDGNSSSLENPVHNYTMPGTYLAKQTITGPGGCEDVFFRKIVVKGPTGTFHYTPRIGCNPLNVTFTAVTQNRSSFLWDFTDGSTEYGNDSTVMHTYTTAGDYIPRMVLTDALGCNVLIEGADTIHVIGVSAAFTTAHSVLCDAGDVTFINETVSNDYIADWHWQFGDGSSSDEQQPIHHYALPGVYNVSLLAIAQQGCSDSVSQAASVTVYQRPLIAIAGDTSACVPANARFAATIGRGEADSLRWNWNFGNNTTASLQSPADVMYAAAGNYVVTVIVTDQHQCSDTSHHPYVVHALPNVNAGPDLAYCLGTPSALHVTGAESYHWEPLPGLSCIDCDGPLAAPGNPTVYSVSGTSIFGCISSDSVKVTPRYPFHVRVSDPDTLCLGETMRLTASGAAQYQWTPASSLSDPRSASTLAKPLTTTTYIVTGSDEDHCFTDSASIFVKVYPMPTVNAGADLSLAVGSAITMHGSGSADISNWSWTPAYNISCVNCTDPEVRPRHSTDYTVKVSNEGGCTAADQVSIFVTCNNGNLFIPNTFSPNGNGMNERFYLRGRGISGVRSLKIFNRWGEVVFERNNFNINDAASGWDGTFKGKQLASDVFVYTCEVICENMETLEYKGDITLIR